jgi:hypothetical protein
LIEGDEFIIGGRHPHAGVFGFARIERRFFFALALLRGFLLRFLAF